MTNEEIRDIKAEFSVAIEDLSLTYSIIKRITGSDQVEVLFYSQHKKVFYDKVKGTQLDSKYLDDNSIIGHSYRSKKSYVVQNVNSNKYYNIAIDNPFRVEIRGQIVIPLIFNDKFEGYMRLSKIAQNYTQENLDNLKHFKSSFRDIFLNERHSKNMEVQKNPFSLGNLEVYQRLKEIHKIYDHLSQHTENPETEKLIKTGKINVDSLLLYLNPNHDNLTKIKKELRQLNKNKYDPTKSFRALIADDVRMNVKILESMLNSEEIISDILVAYDGNETVDVLNDARDQDSPIDILFLDHHMPGKLGLEIAKDLKEPRSEHAPIIVSITNDPDAIKNNDNLYDYHLSKPFSKKVVSDIFTNIKEKYNR